MRTFVLIPGAGGSPWCWSRIVPLLESAGHDVVAVDLPAEDLAAGLADYVDAVLTAVGERKQVDLVAHSLGGFTAAAACALLSVTSIALVNAMVPLPGEAAGAWWDATGAVAAREAAAATGGWGEFDVATYFLHDLPPDVLREVPDHERDQAEGLFGSTCEFAWPDVPMKVLSGADDRFFPAEFQRRVAQDRLGRTPDVLPGGHLMMLSGPAAVAAYLLDG